MICDKAFASIRRRPLRTENYVGIFVGIFDFTVGPIH